MASSSDFRDRTLFITLKVKASDPALLGGLEHLYQQGLLSEEQIRQLAQRQLTCPCPELSTVVTVKPDAADLKTGIGRLEGGLVTEPRQRPLSGARRDRRLPGERHSWLQAFLEEVSVLWLLFLGLFLVVLSSAVLAASQWQNVSAIGQYLILFIYSLAFWGAGLWAKQQPKLQLTATMLERVTLLLVPINFWAMDGFGLWSMADTGAMGWAVALVSAIALTVVYWRTLKPKLAKLSQPNLIITNALALNLLHWGWGWSIMPLLASYMGMVGTSLRTVYASGDKPAAGDQAKQAAQTAQSLELLLLFGALLLVGRAVLVAGVPLSQLGLALGLCGAVLLWRDRLRPSAATTTEASAPTIATTGTATTSTAATGTAAVNTTATTPWSWAGSGLMLLGWLLSLDNQPPLQAFAISLLAVALLVNRLRRWNQPLYLTGLFLVGLQSLWLTRRFAPEALRENLVEQVSAIAGSAGMPFATVGVTVFPYLLLFVWLGDRYRHTNHPALARQSHFLATVLGAGLTLFSIGNPLLRAINLSLSAITLGVCIQRSNAKTKGSWITLLQLLIWGAIFSWFYYAMPTMEAGRWALLCLIGVGLEWGLSLSKGSLALRLSGWVSGLLLAILSYGLFGIDWLNSIWAITGTPGQISVSPMLWWLEPVGLVLLAQRPRCLYPRTTQVFALIAIALVQPFGLAETSTRLVSFGLAILLSGIISRSWPRLTTAAIALGWAILFNLTLTHALLPGSLSGETLLLSTAAQVGLLWGLWGWLSLSDRPLIRCYGQAANLWAIILGTPVALSLLSVVADHYGQLFALSINHYSLTTPLLPSIGLGVALVRRRENAVAHGLALFLSLGLALAMGQRGAPLWALAIAYLAIAWLLLLPSEFWLARQPAPDRSTASKTSKASDKSLPASPFGPADLRFSCHSLPLLFAATGMLLGHGSFTATTGLFSLAAAFILIGVGRRQAQFKLLSYLGLLAMSFGYYELLFYQLSIAEGGNPGDGITLLAGLAIALAWLLYAATPRLSRIIHLEVIGLRQFSQAHWAVGSIIAATAPLFTLSDSGGFRWMGLLLLGGAYALENGKGKSKGIAPNKASEKQSQDVVFPWLDAALIQLLSALGYGIHRLFYWPTFLLWAAAIACPIAMMLEVIPWERGGWSRRAGQRWAGLLPIIAVLLTSWDITTQGLLFVATFYAGLAQRRRSIRLSYISLGLLDWAVLRVMLEQQWIEPLLLGLLISANLLYLAQLEPLLRQARELRHWLRCLGTVIVCFTAFYQAEVGLFELSPFVTGLLAIALSLGFVLAGIALRIRAFLYIGTIAFVLRVLLQVWQFIQTDSLFLWAIGIVLGLMLIWIAATFEARRSQLSNLLNLWVTGLESWD